ncbi:MAG: addiction module protein [Nitrospira sp.]|nr:addiction module protein [Nitrospira sp.]
MSFNLPLKDMSLHEKLTAMETLWEDIARTPETIKSPTWHKDILEERHRRLGEGRSQFVDCETAKGDIRKSCENQDPRRSPG